MTIQWTLYQNLFKAPQPYPPVPLVASESPVQFFKPNFPAHQQRYEDLAPYFTNVIQSSNTAGNIDSEIVNVGGTIIVHNMQYAAQPITPPVTSVPGEFSVQQTKAPLAAAQQQFEALAPFGFAPTTGPLRFTESPPQFGKPFSAALQRIPDLAPFGFAATTGPLTFAESPPQFGKAFLAALQRIPDLAPFGYAATTGPLRFAESPPQFGKPFLAALQRWAQDWVNVPPNSIVGTPGPLQGINTSPEQFAKPFLAALQRFADNNISTLSTVMAGASDIGGIDSAVIQPTTVIAHNMQWWSQTPSAAATPSAFGYSQSPEQFGKPFLAALQRYPDFTPAGTIVSVTPQGGYSELWWRVASPLNTALQQFAAFQPLGTVVSATLPTFMESPMRIASPVLPQRFPDFTPQGTIVSVTPQGGMSELWYRFGKAFPTADQQFAGQVVPAPFQPQPYSESPVKFAIALAAAQQQFNGQVVPKAFQPYVFTISPERFTSPLAAALQQFENSYGYLAPSQFFAQAYVQLPDQFAKPYNVSLQQYTASFGFNPPPPVSTTTTLFFSESPARFGTPLSPVLQQYTLYTGFTPSPLGLGRRKPLFLQGLNNFPASYWPDGNG